MLPFMVARALCIDPGVSLWIITGDPEEGMPAMIHTGTIHIGAGNGRRRAPALGFLPRLYPTL